MIVGIYGVSGASSSSAATALARMAAGAGGLHRGRSRTLLVAGVAVAAYPRAGEDWGESILERDDMLIVTAGHLRHPKFDGEGPARIVGRLLDEGSLSDGLAQCVGEFAVVVVDRHTGELTLATDYLGIRPLFHASTEGVVLFGSNVWPIFDSRGVARELDYDGLASWLLFHHPQGTSTLFRGITKVPPGTVVRHRNGTMTASDYRRARADPGANGRDLPERIHDIVSRTCRSLTCNWRSMALLLSGGFDSRYVACLLRRQGVECTAYTVPFESGDAAVAPVVAARLDIPLRTVPLPGSLDDAHGDPEGWSAAGFPIGRSVTCLAFDRFEITRPTADGFVGDTLVRGWDVDGRSTAMLEGARRGGSLPEAIVSKESQMDPMAVFRPALARRIRERVVAQVSASLAPIDRSDADRVTLWVLQNRKANWIAYNHLQNLESTETVHPFYSPELIECRLSHPHSLFTWALYHRLFERFPEVADVPHSSAVPRRFNAVGRWSWFHWRRAPGLTRDLLADPWARRALRGPSIALRVASYGTGVRRWSYLARYLHTITLLIRRLEANDLAVEWERF